MPIGINKIWQMPVTKWREGGQENDRTNLSLAELEESKVENMRNAKEQRYHQHWPYHELP